MYKTYRDDAYDSHPKKLKGLIGLLVGRALGLLWERACTRWEDTKASFQ